MNRDHAADFLLVHSTNYPYEPFYPYALVMVSARARRAGLRVKRLELSNLDPAETQFWLKRAVETHQPRMIGFTLRQTDSYIFRDYVNCEEDRYYPVATLRDSIRQVKQWTDAPVVVGGFGFTSAGIQIAEYLGLDYGVKGSCDPFIDHFEALVSGRNLADVPNLIYREDGRFKQNRRLFTGPFDGLEYNDEMIDEIIAYYGRSITHGRSYLDMPPGDDVWGPGFDLDAHRRNVFLSLTPTIPIEVSRGCRFRCYFCSEPLVKGQKVFTRDLDLVEEEIRFLLSKDLRNFWFICSELNAGSSEFPLLVAERMMKINEGLGNRPLNWKAYHLPRWISRDELDFMYRSGFTTSWNDVVSYDNDQLRKGRIPFRAKHAIQFIKDDYAIREKYNKLPPLVFSLFLGDAFLTPYSLSETMREYNHHRLTETCRGGAAICGMRVFDYEYNKIPEEQTTTFTPAGRSKDVDLLQPSYRVPPEVMADFGDYDGVFEFYDYICSTLISINHRGQKDWRWFLGYHSRPAIILHLLNSREATALEQRLLEGELPRSTPAAVATLQKLLTAPSIDALQAVLYPLEGGQVLAAEVARLLMLVLYGRCFETFRPVLDHLEIPVGADDVVACTEYELMGILYRRFEHEDAVVAHVTEQFGLDENDAAWLLLHHLLFQFNVVLRPIYKKWLYCAQEEPALVS